jgi:MFS family permease
MLVDRVGAKSVLLFGTAVKALGAHLLSSAQMLAVFIGFQIILAIGLSAMSSAPVRYVVLAESNDKERASTQSMISLVTSFGTIVSSTLAGAFLASGSDVGNSPSVKSFQDVYFLVVFAAVLGFVFSLGLKNKHNSMDSDNNKEKNH